MVDSHFHDHTVLIPSPSFHIDLATLDALHPIHYSRRLLIFRCKSSAQRDAQLTALKSGLQALLSKCPFLGGIINPATASDTSANNGHSQQGWCTLAPGPGLELVVKDVRPAMPSFEELEAANFPFLDLPYDLLVPVPQDIPADKPFAACKVQLNAIEGGTILAFAMSHSVADGSGNNELFRILAEETKLAQDSTHNSNTRDAPSTETSTSALLGFDRSVLRNMKSELPFDIKDHPAFVSKPTTTSTNTSPSESSPKHAFEATTPEIPILFRLSTSNLAQLKADATQANAPPISTHDALAALVWRSILLIRSRRVNSTSNPNSTSLPATCSFFMPTDARRHLGLPSSYIGNAVYQLTATLDLSILLSPMPTGLQHAAAAIRRAITAMNPTLISSYMAQLNETWLDWGFMTCYSTTGVGMGTDWTSGPALYEQQDWGEAFGGKLVRFRYPDESCNCVMPRLPNGDAEVVVSVMASEVEFLKSEECMGRYTC